MKLPVSALTAAVLGVLSLVTAPTIFFVYGPEYTHYADVPTWMTMLVFSSFFFGVLGGIGGLPYFLMPGASRVQRIMGGVAVITSVIGSSAMVSVLQPSLLERLQGLL